jgi:hypothetical protein
LSPKSKQQNKKLKVVEKERNKERKKYNEIEKKKLCA